MLNPDIPLVAILRGLQPAQTAEVGAILFSAGFRLLEVPLNRPGAIECITTLVNIAPADALIGGGTMLTLADVDAVRMVGGRLFVAPNFNATVLRHAVHQNMFCAPGIATPTEAFAALGAGAHALKIFPAESVGRAGLKAMQSVLPTATKTWPVGGISAESMGEWVTAGATGFGIGSNLFSPGMRMDTLAQRAAQFVHAWRSIIKQIGK